MGLTSDSHAACACRGLVRVRQQQPLSGSRRGGGGDSLLLLLDARAAGHLQEDAWYLCELYSGRPPTLRWLSIAGDDDDDCGGGGIIDGSGDAGDSSPVRLVTTTSMSHFEAMSDPDASGGGGDDGAENEEPRASLAEFNGLKLEAEECSFYMEDQVHGVRLALGCVYMYERERGDVRLMRSGFSSRTCARWSRRRSAAGGSRACSSVCRAPRPRRSPRERRRVWTRMTTSRR